MDNSPKFSPPEPLNPETTPLGIEWSAISLGFVAGIVWWFSRNALWGYSLGYLFKKYGNDIFEMPWFSPFSLFFNFVSPLAYGILIGFIVGYRARHHPHRFAVVVIILLFVLTLFYSVIYNWRITGLTGYFSFYNILFMAIGLILNLAGTLNGVYLAKSVKRNRGVRIQ